VSKIENMKAVGNYGNARRIFNPSSNLALIRVTGISARGSKKAVYNPPDLNKAKTGVSCG
jgi:hypothetical protein